MRNSWLAISHRIPLPSNLRKSGACKFHRAGGSDRYARAGADHVVGGGGDHGKCAREDEDDGSVKARRPQNAAEDFGGKEGRLLRQGEGELVHLFGAAGQLDSFDQARNGPPGNVSVCKMRTAEYHGSTPLGHPR